MNWAIEHAQRLTAEGIVNAYGVILFEARHAFIAKVLEDSRYWAALDQVSGKGFRFLKKNFRFLSLFAKLLSK